MSFWEGKNVVVTGGAGFLGSHLVHRLQGKGCKPFVVRSAAYDLRYLTDISQMLIDVGPTDVLFHLAATVGGIGLNQEHPGLLFYENAVMGIQLIEQARLHGVKKFVCVGSVCAYPRSSYTLREECLWDGYPDPTNAPYGLAKKMLLVQLQAYREEYGFNGIYILPTNLYGPCFSGDTDVLTPNGIRNIQDMQEGDPIYTLNPDTHGVEIATVVATQRVMTDEFLNFRSKSVDFRVTPDHMMYYRTGTAYQKKRAEFFRKRAGNLHGQLQFAVHHSMNRDKLSNARFSLEKFTDQDHLIDIKGKAVRDYAHSRSRPVPHEYDITDWIEFLGWYITEGSTAGCYPQHNTYGQSRITQSKEMSPDNYQQIHDLLVRMQIPFGYDHRAFYFTSRLFRNYINAEIGLGAINKRIPKFVFEEGFPYALRKLLFDTMMQGDGNSNGRRYSTISKRLRDDFVHLCFLLGYQTIWFWDSCWRIGIRKGGKRPTVKYRNVSVEEAGCEPAYCITVDKHHLIYAGRGGKFNWIGQCDNFNLETSHVIPALIRKCLEADDHIVVWGTGKPSRDFLYVEDAAEGLILAAEKYDRPEPLNLGSGREVGIAALVHYIQRATGFEGKIVWDTSKPDGQPKRVLDSSRAEHAIGWEAETSLIDGLRKTVEWYRAALST